MKMYIMYVLYEYIYKITYTGINIYIPSKVSSAVQGGEDLQDALSL